MRAEADVSDVAFLVDVTSSTATRLVDTAVRAGLLQHRRSAYSGRWQLWYSPGKDKRCARVLSERDPYWLSGQLDGWSAAEVEQFGQLLQRFADGLHARPFD